MMNKSFPFHGLTSRALRSCAAVAVGAGLLALAPRPAHAQVWYVAEVAEDGGSPSTVVWDGAPHAFWVQYGSRIVNTYRSNGAWVNDWLVTLIDGNGTFRSPTAVVFNDKVYVFFHSTEFHTFEYLVSTGPGPAGTSWEHHVLDGVGSEYDDTPKTGNVNDTVGYWSSAVVWNGKLHVAYTDSTTGAMRVGHYDPTTDHWALQVLDGGPTGQSTHTMTGRPTLTVFTGILEAFYYDSTAGDFRGAWTFDGTTWGTTIMDGEGGGNGRNYGYPGFYSSAIVWNDQPNLFYWDQSGGGTLRRAYYDGQWHMSTVDGAAGASYGAVSANVGTSVSAVVNNGQPEVFYYDRTNGNLRELHYRSDFFEPGWHSLTLDGDGGSSGQIDVGLSGRVGIDVSAASFTGVPQVFYSRRPTSAEQTLTYARTL